MFAAPEAGPAPSSARTVTASATRALATPLRLERQPGARPHRQAAHVGAVHDLGGAELPALGELLARRLRQCEGELCRLPGPMANGFDPSVAFPSMIVSVPAQPTTAPAG